MKIKTFWRQARSGPLHTWHYLTVGSDSCLPPTQLVKPRFNISLRSAQACISWVKAVMFHEWPDHHLGTFQKCKLLRPTLDYWGRNEVNGQNSHKNKNKKPHLIWSKPRLENIKPEGS
jgi:hypothetical protein